MSRILVYSDRGDVYGAEQINHRLALGLADAGLAVSMAQPEADNCLVAEREARGIPHHWLPAEDLYNWHHPAPSLTDPSAARRCFAELRPDLILFADSFPFASLAAKGLAVRSAIPYLVLIHCVQPGWAEQYRGFLARLPELYRTAVEVVAVSGENLDLLRRGFGLPPDKGRVIHNGRPPAFFAPRAAQTGGQLRAALGIPGDAVVALSIGRLELSKGWQYLLDALRLLRGCAHWGRLQLLWVGSGTLEGQVRRVSGLLGQGRVRLLAPRDDVPALMDAADLLVHPARFEGMPLVVLEAMAKGLPVIATAVSGIPEALGGAGVLLDPPEDAAGGAPGGDPRFVERLAAAVCDLAGDEALRDRLGAAAHREALVRFTEARMVGEHLALARRALAGA